MKRFALILMSLGALGLSSPAFAALRLSPWQLRVFPGTVLLGQGGEVLVWEQP